MLSSFSFYVHHEVVQIGSCAVQILIPCLIFQIGSCFLLYYFRMIFTECNPSTCPCKDQCSNQRLQKHEEQEGLQKFYTVDRGQGVLCKKDIATGKLKMDKLWSNKIL